MNHRLSLRCVLRRAFVAGIALAALAASSTARADSGTVVLTSGEVIAGDIQSVVKGEYVLVKLPSGEVKAIAWAQIGQVNVGGSVTVGVPGAPPPPPVYQPAPTPPPPAVYAPPPAVYAPPPPPPSYAPPPPAPPPPAPAFQPSFMLGARLGSITPGGYLSGREGNGVRLDSVVSSGWMVEGNLGYHFSPAWTFYGFWEHGQLSAPKDLDEGGTTNLVGIGMNANTSPRGPVGFYFDIGAGYRFLQFGGTTRINGIAVTTDKILVEGFVPIRIAFGLSVVPTRKFRLDLAVQGSGGTFTRTKGGACPDGCAIEGEKGTHTMVGFVAGARWDL